MLALCAVWSPAGGWWANPRHWKRNTAIAYAFIGTGLMFTFSFSAAHEVRDRRPLPLPPFPLSWPSCRRAERLTACARTPVFAEETDAADEAHSVAVLGQARLHRRPSPGLSLGALACAGGVCWLVVEVKTKLSLVLITSGCGPWRPRDACPSLLARRVSKLLRCTCAVGEGRAVCICRHDLAALSDSDGASKTWAHLHMDHTTAPRVQQRQADGTGNARPWQTTRARSSPLQSRITGPV